MKIIFPQFTFITSPPMDPGNGSQREEHMRFQAAQQQAKALRLMNRRNHLHREEVRLCTKNNKNSNNPRGSVSSVTTQKLFL